MPTSEARENGFGPTLARYATERTKAIYYNTPQNPNGVVLTSEEAKAVAQFVQERDLVVIADEAYEDLVYEWLTAQTPRLISLLARASPGEDPARNDASRRPGIG